MSKFQHRTQLCFKFSVSLKSSLNLGTCSGRKPFLLVERRSCHGNPGFIFTCTSISCIICYQATWIGEIFHIVTGNPCFDVLLTAHLSRYNFSKRPTWRTITLFYNTFVTVLYMFRASSCSSSGGQIILIQHLVWSLSASGRPVHRTATYREWPYQMLY